MRSDGLLASLGDPQTMPVEASSGQLESGSCPETDGACSILSESLLEEDKRMRSTDPTSAGMHLCLLTSGPESD